MTDDRTEAALRRALHDAARQVDVPMGTLPEPAHEPVVVAQGLTPRVTAALVVALLVVAGSIAFIARDTDSPTTIASSGVGAEPITSDNADVTIVMSEVVTDEQLATVRDFLEESTDVAAYTFRDKEASYRALQANYACRPDLVSHATPENMSSTFLVRVTSIDVALDVARAVVSFVGVDQVDAGVTHVTPEEGTGSTTTGPPSPTIVVAPTVASATAGGTADVAATTTTLAAEPSTTVADATTTPSKEIPYVLPAPAACPPGQSSPSPTVVQPGTTTPVTLPPAGDPPADPVTAEEEVRDMWARAFSATTPEVERLALHQVYDTHPELKDGGLPQNQQYKDNLRVKILDVVFVSPTRAAVQYRLEFPALGNMTFTPSVGYAALTDSGWKVSKETTCGLMAQGGRPCPAGT